MRYGRCCSPDGWKHIRLLAVHPMEQWPNDKPNPDTKPNANHNTDAIFLCTQGF